MQKVYALLGLFAFAFVSTQLHAGEAELSLNDDTVKLAGQFDLSGFDVELSFLHNQDRGNVLGVAGLLYGDAGAEGLNAGLGLKLAYIDPDISEPLVCISPPCGEFTLDGGLALPIGGKVTYVPTEYNRFNARGYLWFAPSVLAFGDVERYQEIGADVGYNVTRNADVFLGYRNIKGKIKTNLFGDVTGTIDTGLHLGIRGRF